MESTEMGYSDHVYATKRGKREIGKNGQKRERPSRKEDAEKQHGNLSEEEDQCGPVVGTSVLKVTNGQNLSKY